METREWKTIKEYQDILFDFYNGIAKITINRPRYRNAFTPTTTSEISDALYYCRECQDINVVVLTGAGDKAFCSGGDMHVKGHGGYIGTDGVPRLNVQVLFSQRQKVVLTLAIRGVLPCTSFSYVLLRLRLLSAFARTAPAHSDGELHLCRYSRHDLLRAYLPRCRRLCRLLRSEPLH